MLFQLKNKLEISKDLQKNIIRTYALFSVPLKVPLKESEQGVF